MRYYIDITIITTSPPNLTNNGNFTYVIIFFFYFIHQIDNSGTKKGEKINGTRTGKTIGMKPSEKHVKKKIKKLKYKNKYSKNQRLNTLKIKKNVKKINKTKYVSESDIDTDTLFDQLDAMANYQFSSEEEKAPLPTFVRIKPRLRSNKKIRKGRRKNVKN